MSDYEFTASDHAFTVWLATRSPSRVRAEAHAHLSKPERQLLAYHMGKPRRGSKPAPPVETPQPPAPVFRGPVRQQFTQAQLDIAAQALKNRREANG